MKTTMFKIKTVLLTTLLSIAFTSGLLAQDKSEYKQAMGSVLQEMASVKENSAYLDLANQFQRIAEKETTEWLPNYYAALCTTIYSFGEQDKKKIDPILDQAQSLLDKSLKLKENESELWVMQGMIHQARIMVDPMVRGMNFITKVNEAFGKAEALNAENPRVYYLQGQTLLNTPEMYGGGKKAAKPLFQKAHEKFLNFKPAESFCPNWGQEHNDQLLKTCE